MNLKVVLYLFLFLLPGSDLFPGNNWGKSKYETCDFLDDLRWSLEYNSSEKIKAILNVDPLRVESIIDDQTALTFAATRSSPEVLALVLSYMPDTSKTDSDEWTALGRALRYSSFENVKMLIDRSYNFRTACPQRNDRKAAVLVMEAFQETKQDQSEKLKYYKMQRRWPAKFKKAYRKGKIQLPFKNIKALNDLVASYVVLFDEHVSTKPEMLVPIKPWKAYKKSKKKDQK